MLPIEAQNQSPAYFSTISSDLLRTISSFLTTKEKASILDLVSKAFKEAFPYVGKLDLSYFPKASSQSNLIGVRPLPLESILLKYKKAHCPIVEINLSNRSLSKNDFIKLSQIESLQTLNLSSSDIPDIEKDNDNLSGLEKLPHLKNLNLACVRIINDKWIKNLVKLHTLSVLDISYTKISPQGFYYLYTALSCNTALSRKTQIIYKSTMCFLY